MKVKSRWVIMGVNKGSKDVVFLFEAGDGRRYIGVIGVRACALRIWGFLGLGLTSRGKGVYGLGTDFKGKGVHGFGIDVKGEGGSWVWD